MNNLLDKIFIKILIRNSFLWDLWLIWKWREDEGIEPPTAFTQKPSIRVEACGAHQVHLSPT
jgi:hypothetical protein